MEPFYVLFIMFSPLWWLLIIGACAAIIFALENERGLWATITLVTTLVLLNFFGTTPILSWIRDEPWYFLSGVVGFFVVGGIWGVIKWYFFNTERLEKYEIEKRNWLHDHGVTSKEIPEDKKVEWIKFLQKSSIWSYSPRYSGDRVINVAPLVSQHLSTISMWMTYWPWSMLWSLFDDVIRNIFRKIQRQLNGLMESITNRVFHNVDSDIMTIDEVSKKK